MGNHNHASIPLLYELGTNDVRHSSTNLEGQLLRNSRPKGRTDYRNLTKAYLIHYLPFTLLACRYPSKARGASTLTHSFINLFIDKAPEFPPFIFLQSFLHFT